MFSKDIFKKKALSEQCDVKIFLGAEFENEAKPVALSLQFSKRDNKLITDLEKTLCGLRDEGKIEFDICDCNTEQEVRLDHWRFTTLLSMHYDKVAL